MKDLADILLVTRDSDPMTIVNEALTLLGIEQGDLTPATAGEVDMVDFADVLRPGDHVVVRERDYPVEHHAIYLGRSSDTGNRTSVADLWGSDQENAVIRIRPMSHFLAGRTQLLVVHYSFDARTDRFRTLTYALARAMAANRVLGLYNIVGYNCQHFATFCRTFRYDPNTLSSSTDKLRTVSFERLRSFK